MTALERKRATDRVRELLAALGHFDHLDVRGHGAHILVSVRPTNGERRQCAAPASEDLARLTSLGNDAYGLSFRGLHGGWDEMLLVDTLDEIVDDMTAALDPAA
jgi:hypothetical protein